jgi:hypothetical protein
LATPGDNAVNGGLYALFTTATGSQQFTATDPGYTTSTQTATITAGQVSDLNFALAASSPGSQSARSAPWDAGPVPPADHRNGTTGNPHL